MLNRVIIAVLALGLAGCFEGECKDQVSAPVKPDRSAEVASLQGRLDAAQQDSAIAMRDLDWKKKSLDTAYQHLKERDESADRLAGYMLNPKGFSAQLSKEIEKQLLKVDGAGSDIVQMIQDGVYDAIGQYGQSAMVRIMDNLVGSPEISWAIYQSAKPALIPMARMLSNRYDTVAVVISKRYDPFMGALAATEGHYCRFELTTPEDQKSERCNKVFAKLNAYYGVAMDRNIIKTLGVMHRRYLNEAAGTHDGFNGLRGIATDILDELQKKS